MRYRIKVTTLIDSTKEYTPQAKRSFWDIWENLIKDLHGHFYITNSQEWIYSNKEEAEQIIEEHIICLKEKKQKGIKEITYLNL